MDLKGRISAYALYCIAPSSVSFLIMNSLPHITVKGHTWLGTSLSSLLLILDARWNLKQVKMDLKTTNPRILLIRVLMRPYGNTSLCPTADMRTLRELKITMSLMTIAKPGLINPSLISPRLFHFGPSRVFYVFRYGESNGLLIMTCLMMIPKPVSSFD